MRLIEMNYGAILFRIAWPFFLQRESKYRTSAQRERQAKITQAEIARLFADDFKAHRQ